MKRFIVLLALLSGMASAQVTFTTNAPQATFGTSTSRYRAFMSTVRTPSGCIIGYRDGPGHTGQPSYGIAQVSTDGCNTFAPYSGVSYDCGGFAGCMATTNSLGQDIRGPFFLYDGTRLLAFYNNLAGAVSTGCLVQYSDDYGASWSAPAALAAGYYWCAGSSNFTYNGHPCVTANPRNSVSGGSQNWLCSLDHGITWTEVHNYPAAVDQDENAVYWIDNNNGLILFRKGSPVGTLWICTTTTGPTGFSCAASNIAPVTPLCAVSGGTFSSYSDVSPSFYAPTSIPGYLTLLYSERQICTGGSGAANNYLRSITFIPASVIASPAALPAPQTLNVGVKTNGQVDYGYQSMTETTGSNVLITWYGHWTNFSLSPIPITMTGAYAGIPTSAICFTNASIYGTGTSSAINTIGATLLVAVVSSYNGFNTVINDSVGNRDWQTAQEYDINGTGSGPFNLILYKPAPATSSSYLFSIYPQVGLSFQSATVYACSGTTLDHPLAEQAGLGGGSGGSSTWQPGSVTPVEIGDLIFAAGTNNTNGITATINSGFSTPVINDQGGYEVSVSAWKAAPSTSPVNPTWTTNRSAWVGSQAVFKVASATPPPLGNLRISSVVGTGSEGFGGDGAAAVDALTDYPGEIVKESHGGICFADVNNNRIRCYNPTAGPITVYGVTIASGQINTIAGNGTLGFVYNVAPLSAEMGHPVGLAIDASDCMYIADQQNSRILKMCPGTNLTVVAGGDNGGGVNTGCRTPGSSDDAAAGFSGDGGAATSALLRCPQGVSLNAGGDIFISDANNYSIRVVNTHATTQTINGVSVCSGCIQTIFGDQINNCSLAASGITSSIGLPVGSPAVDSSGNLYAANYGCNAVFKLDSAGVPSRYAGSASYTAGYSGDGGPATLATLRQPFTVKLTGSRDLYITDTGNSVIRLVDHATQIITTPMGDYSLYPYDADTYWHTGGYCCDGGAASLAGMGFPIGLYIDEVAHKWYISDLLSSRLRLAYLVSGGTSIANKSKMSSTGVKVQ